MNVATDRAREMAAVRAVGMTGIIRDASDWRRRADALYAEADARELPWYGPGAIGLLADGRMAIITDAIGIAEVRS